MTTAARSMCLDDPRSPIDPTRAVELLSDPTLVAGHGLDLSIGIVAAERLIAWAQGTQMSLMAALMRPGVAGDCMDMVADAQCRADTNEPDVLAAMGELACYQAARSLASAQLAAVLRIAPITAALRLDSAVEIVDELPATHRALLEGRIDRTKALVIADRTRPLAPHLRSEVESLAAEVCATRTTGKSIPLVDQAVIAADPEAAEHRRKTAVRGRRVERTALPDGMGMISAHLAADKADTVFALVDVIATATKGLDHRGVDARRADALTDLAELLLSGASVDLTGVLDKYATETTETTETTGTPGTDDQRVDKASDPGHVRPSEAAPAAAESPETWPSTEASAEAATVALSSASAPHASSSESAPHSGAASTPTDCPTRPSPDRRGWTLPHRRGRPVHLTVTLTLDALIGLRDDPAVVAGWGAITADWARTLAKAAGSVTLLVTDPVSGAALGASARTYRARQSVRDEIITMNPTCVFLGCSVPAVRCDLDHRDPFDHRHPERGGPTVPVNLDPLCRPHHQLKTHGGWTYRRLADRSLEFTSPLGTVVQSPPPVPLLARVADDPPPF